MLLVYFYWLIIVPMDRSLFWDLDLASKSLCNVYILYQIKAHSTLLKLNSIWHRYPSACSLLTMSKIRIWDSSPSFHKKMCWKALIFTLICLAIFLSRCLIFQDFRMNLFEIDLKVSNSNTFRGSLVYLKTYLCR